MSAPGERALGSAADHAPGARSAATRAAGARVSGNKHGARKRLGRKPTGRELSAAQVEAAAAIMRLFVDDDLERGIRPEQVGWCHACQTWQPLAGAIPYDEVVFCNACAATYELARLRGVAPPASGFRNGQRPVARLQSG